MEVLEAIKSRRSVRSYVPADLSSQQLQTLLEAATWAPSAGNLQPWEFVIVDNKDVMKQLARASLNQMWMVEASTIVAVCADLERTGMIYGERGKRLYAIQDCAAATQNLLLAACSMGLGTCWVGAFFENEVRGILKLPSHVRPLALITIGKPGEQPTAPPRKRLHEIVHYNAFGNPWVGSEK